MEMNEGANNVLNPNLVRRIIEGSNRSKTKKQKTNYEHKSEYLLLFRGADWSKAFPRRNPKRHEPVEGVV